MHRLLPILRIFLTALLAIVCVCGDWLVGLNSNSPIAKAIFDNATHAGVGLLTAAILFIQLERRISSAERNAAIIVCCLVSSIIDIDHFIAARSWKLTNATHLQQRPIFHCTTIPLLLLVAAVFVHKYRSKLWLAVIVCAFLSHHTRDATRRGYWIWPIGHTKPVPYCLYILFSQMIPFIIGHLLNEIGFADSNPRTYNATIV